MRSTRVAACFPAGTLSGAPKVRAMEIIEELEPVRRGVYGGAILYADYAGNLDSCIAIRTMVVHRGRAYVQAGAGIVADSDPESEYQECMNKASALLRAAEKAGDQWLVASGQCQVAGKEPEIVAVKQYQDLIAWQKAIALVTEIYKAE